MKDDDGGEVQGGSLDWGPGEAGSVSEELIEESPVEDGSETAGDDGLILLDDDDAGDGDGDGEGEEAEGSEAAKADTSEEGKKGSRARKRIEQLVSDKRELISERDLAQGRVEELETKVSDLEAELGSAGETPDGLVQAFDDAYGQFENPVHQMSWDAAFAEAADALSASDETVAKACEAIKKAMKEVPLGEKDTGKAKAEKKVEEKPTEVKTDPKVEKALRMGIRSVVSDFVKRAGVKPEYVKLVENQLMTKVDDPEISDSDLLKVTKDVFSENGLSAKMVIAAQEKKKTTRPGSRASGAAISDDEKGKGKGKGEEKGKGGSKEEEPPKTMLDFSKRQNQRVRSLLDEARAEQQ